MNSRTVLDVVKLPASYSCTRCPLDVMVPCNAFKCTPLRVQVFEA